LEKLYYYFCDERFNNIDDRESLLEEMISPISSSKSKWFESFPVIRGGFKSVPKLLNFIKENVLSKGQSDSFESEILDNNSYTTIRACPGIKLLFKNSFLVKCPCDVHIRFDEKLHTFISTCSDPQLCITSCHVPDQYKTPKHSLFQNKHNIKFELPICLQTDSTAIFLQPTYHEDVPFEVLPGVVQMKEFNLNINTMFNFDKGDYFIKKGTPLCYIYFDKPYELKYTKKRHILFRKNFISPEPNKNVHS
jgi:hypothetical protein